jgi:transcriptional regulator with XRE-family HTH domain
MSSLPNYLLTARKRLGLTQEEVAFLLGFGGESKGGRVSRYENFTHEPDLQIALGFERIYATPAHELFAGIREEMDQQILARAKVLRHRLANESNPSRDELVNDLIARIPEL